MARTKQTAREPVQNRRIAIIKRCAVAVKKSKIVKTKSKTKAAADKKSKIVKTKSKTKAAAGKKSKIVKTKAAAAKKSTIVKVKAAAAKKSTIVEKKKSTIVKKKKAVGESILSDMDNLMGEILGTAAAMLAVVDNDPATVLGWLPQPEAAPVVATDTPAITAALGWLPQPETAPVVAIDTPAITAALGWLPQPSPDAVPRRMQVAPPGWIPNPNTVHGDPREFRPPYRV
jgi:hypothetical protein